MNRILLYLPDTFPAHVRQLITAEVERLHESALIQFISCEEYGVWIHRTTDRWYVEICFRDQVYNYFTSSTDTLQTAFYDAFRNMLASAYYPDALVSRLQLCLMIQQCLHTEFRMLILPSGQLWVTLWSYFSFSATSFEDGLVAVVSRINSQPLLAAHWNTYLERVR